MDNEKRYKREVELFSKNPVYKLLQARAGYEPGMTPKAIEGINDMADFLQNHGGYHQQERMIRDKRKSLDRALVYSYQAGLVRKQGNEDDTPIRALINPNKLKADYDEKIISVGWEHDFHSGDVFEWVNTNSYWLIYLQDLTELAYFRGEVRRCSYQIEWVDENGDKKKTYAAVRGPVETKINSIQKHQIRVDEPNYTLNMYIPKNDDNLAKFVRYSKFYLPGITTCWKVTVADSISTPGIIELTAIEDYANTFEDDVANGIVEGLKVEPLDPNPSDIAIIGETFIKVKKEYVFYFNGNKAGQWYVTDKKLPVKLEPFINEDGFRAVRIKWDSSYSGQFDLYYGNQSKDIDLKKTIIVESLF